MQSLKRPILLLLMTALTLPAVSFAQPAAGKISGTIQNAGSQPLPAISVQLLRASDSSLIKGAATDDQGKFEFRKLDNGAYLLVATGLGYKKYASIPLTLDDRHGSIRLPAIILQRTGANTLAAVAVTAKKALVEEQLDRTVVNVDAMIGNAGSNALDVLSKSPGVTVGTDGSITLNGNGTTVLIDGRPTYLSAADLAAYLRSVPAGVLDKVELMTNPPAKYDAAGATIINIRLKKNRAAGFTGNISAGWNQGTYGRSNDALNLNYHNGKVTLFANLGYSLYKNYGDEDYRRYFYDDNGSLNNAVLMNTRYKTTSNAWNGKLGMDFAASSSTTYGIVLTGNTRPSDDRLDYISHSYDGSMKLDSTGQGYTSGSYKWKNFGANLNFQHRFGSGGKEISADLDYINYDSKGNKHSPNYVTLPDGTPASQLDFQYYAPADIHIYTAKTDYTHPLKGHAKLEAGLKYSDVNTDIATNYYDVSGNISLPDYGQTDHFIYKERIGAAYVSLGKEWKRLSAQVGLRVENTRSQGHQLGNAVVKDSSFSRNYTDLFPTAFFNYKLDSVGNHTLVLRYGRRINRPGYQQLNPFLVYHDKYSYNSGNPYLKPCYNYHIELSWRYKQYLTIGAHYDHVDGIIFSTTSAEGDLFITRPDNIAHGHILFMVTNLSLSPTKWWNFNFSNRWGNLVNKSTINGVYVNKSILIGGFELLNQFRFNKGWSAEVQAMGRSRILSAQNVTKAVWFANTAVQKNIWKEKASLRLTIDDIFYSRKFHDQTTDISHAAAFHSYVEDSRRIGLAFNYRFGKESGERKRRRNNSGADEEQGRVN
ncbi:MAG: TonB-dependent receptor [Chitinophagaceae bacterium]|nr:TonB-dependent receptor [Chitinophagaceae bacterium]